MFDLDVKAKETVDVAGSSFEKGVMEIAYKFSDVILTPVVWLLTGGAMILFVWGLAHFILSSDSTVKENGKNHMVWGVVGLFIIVAVWGIMGFILDSVESLK